MFPRLPYRLLAAAFSLFGCLLCAWAFALLRSIWIGNASANDFAGPIVVMIALALCLWGFAAVLMLSALQDERASGLSDRAHRLMSGDDDIGV